MLVLVSENLAFSLHPLSLEVKDGTQLREQQYALHFLAVGARKIFIRMTTDDVLVSGSTLDRGQIYYCERASRNCTL